MHDMYKPEQWPEKSDDPGQSQPNGSKSRLFWLLMLVIGCLVPLLGIILLTYR